MRMHVHFPFFIFFAVRLCLQHMLNDLMLQESLLDVMDATSHFCFFVELVDKLKYACALSFFLYKSLI